MHTKRFIWVMLTALLVPVAWTQEEAEPAEAVATEAESDDFSPIPRLMELTLDPFVVPARAVNLPLPGRTKTLQDVLDQFEEWSEDEKVGGVLLDIQPLSLGLPHIQELQHGIHKLRKAGKKVFAFVNICGPNGYLLATAADEIALAPIGMITIPGLGNVYPFMKGYYQMRGVEYDVITAGKYKYPGFNNRRAPDEHFKEEFGAIMDSWYKDYHGMIKEGRNLSDEVVTDLINTAIFDADDALQRDLVDKLVYLADYREQLVNRYKMKLRSTEKDGLAAVNSIQDLVELINEGLEKARDEKVGPKIAVLHARGPIIDMSVGSALSSQIISRDDMVKVIEEIRRNKSIKAVVLHVDSPGGSAYASDVIWQHLRALDDEKPLVCSMGTVAGSGGYYIACPARRIFAQPSTITGSIGVLGVFQSNWSQINRMDVELYEVQRGERALLGASHRTLSEEDREMLQEWMYKTYDVFLSRVAQTRKMPVEEVNKVAQGRIWSGRDAVGIGLVDELGGLEDAIQSARKMANIPPSAELEIVHYPRPSSLGELFESLNVIATPNVSTSADPSAALFGQKPNKELGELLVAYQQATSAAQVPSFYEQLSYFAQLRQPLAWTAIPEFYRPAREITTGVLPVSEPMWPSDN
jgi:protease-4